MDFGNVECVGGDSVVERDEEGSNMFVQVHTESTTKQQEKSVEPTLCPTLFRQSSTFVFTICCDGMHATDLGHPPSFARS